MITRKQFRKAVLDQVNLSTEELKAIENEIDRIILRYAFVMDKLDEEIKLPIDNLEQYFCVVANAYEKHGFTIVEYDDPKEYYIYYKED